MESDRKYAITKLKEIANDDNQPLDLRIKSLEIILNTTHVEAQEASN